MQAKKPSFLSNDHALLTAMVQLGDPESCVTLIRNSAASGAEAFGIQLCYIEQKYKTEETYRYIFSRFTLPTTGRGRTPALQTTIWLKECCLA